MKSDLELLVTYCNPLTVAEMLTRLLRDIEITTEERDDLAGEIASLRTDWTGEVDGLQKRLAELHCTVDVLKGANLNLGEEMRKARAVALDQDGSTVSSKEAWGVLSAALSWNRRMAGFETMNGQEKALRDAVALWKSQSQEEVDVQRALAVYDLVVRYFDGLMAWGETMEAIQEVRGNP